MMPPDPRGEVVRLIFGVKGMSRKCKKLIVNVLAFKIFHFSIYSSSFQIIKKAVPDGQPFLYI